MRHVAAICSHIRAPRSAASGYLLSVSVVSLAIPLAFFVFQLLGVGEKLLSREFELAIAARFLVTISIVGFIFFFLFTAILALPILFTYIVVQKYALHSPLYYLAVGGLAGIWVPALIGTNAILTVVVGLVGVLGGGAFWWFTGRHNQQEL